VKNNLKSVFDRELALGCLGGDFDFDRGVNGNVISSVRHPATARMMSTTFGNTQN
jgi:hypothetical protein